MSDAEAESDQFLRMINRYVTAYLSVAHSDPTEAHRVTLQHHDSHFRRIKSSEMCFACLTRPSQIFLPCECSLCEHCCQSLAISTPKPTTIKAFKSCPLCRSIYSMDSHIRLPPSTAGHRILELDGGGVRGINQLKILGRIEEELELPIHIFFDLIVGTSVGGFS